MNISTYIPAAWRKPIYGAFAVIGVLIGAFQVGIAAVGGTDPEWLTVTLAVFPFLAGAIGFTAAANTDKEFPGTDWDNNTHGSMSEYADTEPELED